MTLSIPTLTNIAVLAPLLLYSAWLFRRALRSRSWPTVQATVVESRVIKGGNGARPFIEYAYTIEGRRYQSGRRSVGPALSASGSWAKDAVAACPKGSIVLAVDPDDPACAVLLPGIRRAHILIAAVAGFILVGACFIAVMLGSSPG